METTVLSKHIDNIKKIVVNYILEKKMMTIEQQAKIDKISETSLEEKELSQAIMYLDITSKKKDTLISITIDGVHHIDVMQSEFRECLVQLHNRKLERLETLISCNNCQQCANFCTAMLCANCCHRNSKNSKSYFEEI